MYHWVFGPRRSKRVRVQHGPRLLKLEMVFEDEEGHILRYDFVLGTTANLTFAVYHFHKVISLYI